MDSRKPKKKICSICKHIRPVESMFNNSVCKSCHKAILERGNGMEKLTNRDEEWEAVTHALYKAKEAFYNALEKEYNYDGAYWGLAIDVYFLSSDFRDILQTLSWDNMECKIDGDDDEE